MVMYVHMYLCGQFVVVRVIMTGAHGFMLHITGHCILSALQKLLDERNFNCFIRNESCCVTARRGKPIKYTEG
jgi:hypothetical protein